MIILFDWAIGKGEVESSILSGSTSNHSFHHPHTRLSINPPLHKNTYCKATWNKWHIKCKVIFGWSALFEPIATMIDRKWLHPPHLTLYYIAAQQALLCTQPS